MIPMTETQTLLDGTDAIPDGEDHFPDPGFVPPKTSAAKHGPPRHAALQRRRLPHPKSLAGVALLGGLGVVALLVGRAVLRRPAALGLFPRAR